MARVALGLAMTLGAAAWVVHAAPLAGRHGDMRDAVALLTLWPAVPCWALGITLVSKGLIP